MKTRKILAFAAAFGALVASGSAQAACVIGDLAGKTWRLTGTEVSYGVLFFCTIPVGLATSSTSAPIGAVANGCQDTNWTGNGSVTFTSPAPTPYSIKSGTVTLTNASRCQFDVTLRFNAGTPIARARINLDSGKTVAVGNFLVSWGGFGTWNMVRN